jgi:pyruvate/2-oxoglutarate dehydrogenase complex dihydrolipoamide acyltransferase (E2) component
MTPIILFEHAWDSTDEGSISNWFFDDGAAVAEGDLICEVMVAKAVVEVLAPASGRLKILVGTDTVVAKGTTLAEIH